MKRILAPTLPAGVCAMLAVARDSIVGITTDIECHDGAPMSGVALEGTFAKVAP